MSTPIRKSVKLVNSTEKLTAMKARLDSTSTLRGRRADGSVSEATSQEWTTCIRELLTAKAGSLVKAHRSLFKEGIEVSRWQRMEEGSLPCPWFVFSLVAEVFDIDPDDQLILWQHQLDLWPEVKSASLESERAKWIARQVGEGLIQ